MGPDIFSAKPKSRWKPYLGGFAYGLLLVAALATGSIYGWASRSTLLNRIVRDPLDFMKGDPRKHFGGKDSEVLLILGCDEDRYFRGTYANGSNIIRKYARSDMMLLTKLDFANNEITGLSIPRDTEATLPHWRDYLAPHMNGTHKINAFHSIAKKGLENQATQAVVEHLLPGVHIDRVVVLDFEAMEKLVDTVGGVDVTVPRRMKYDDFAGELHVDLQPGPQHLDGNQAMGYVRFRHDAESDFGRQKRQREFLDSFKSAAYRNPFRLPDLANEGKAVLNDALSDDELYGLISFAARVPKDRIRMSMLPVDELPHNVVRLDKQKYQAALADYGFIPPVNAQASPVEGTR